MIQILTAFSLLVSVAAFATPEPTRNFTPCESLVNHGIDTAEMAFRELSDLAYARYLERRHESPHDLYSALTLDTATEPGRTLHEFPHPGAFDSRWALHLPDAHANVWRRLTRVERLRLLRKLESAFQGGSYAADLAKQTAFETSAFHALYASDEQDNGFSPVLFLGAALAGEAAGVCRHSNMALAGLLLEMGLPGEDLRVIAGHRPGERHGHLFIQVRTAHDSAFYTYDATAKGRPPRPHFNESLSMWSEPELSEGGLAAEREILDVITPLRTLFSDRVVVFREFHVPQIPLSDFPYVIRPTGPEISRVIQEAFDRLPREQAPTMTFILKLDEGK